MGRGADSPAATKIDACCTTSPVSRPPLAISYSAASIPPSQSLNGVARDFLPFPLRPLSPCEVWCSTPSLWVTVAPSLGFLLQGICLSFTPSPVLLHWFESLSSHPSFRVSIRPHRFFRHLSDGTIAPLVFCDVGIFPQLTMISGACMAGSFSLGMTAPWSCPSPPGGPLNLWISSIFKWVDAAQATPGFPW
jgi:hypothetical protein